MLSLVKSLLKALIPTNIRAALRAIPARGRQFLGWLEQRLLPGRIQRRADHRVGQQGLQRLRAEVMTPARSARRPDAMRVIVVNHFYDQDVSAYLHSDHDCEIWVIRATTLDPVRYYYGSVTSQAQYNSPDMQGKTRRAIEHLVGPSVEYLIRKIRPDVVLAPSDVFYWFRPYTSEFQRRGIPVVVQDKEGTVVPGSHVEEHVRRVITAYPPLADLFYHWGEVQRQTWIRAGMDPARIRVLGQPRSDYFFHPERRLCPSTMGLPPGKRLVTFFTFYVNAYVTQFPPEVANTTPWQELRRQLHHTMLDLARARPDLTVVIKCHPQALDLPSIHADLENPPPNIHVMTGAGTASALIAHSAVVVGFQTTAMIEAMLTNLPLIYTAWGEDYQRFRPYLLPFSETNACYEPACAEELRSLLDRILDGQEVVGPDMLRQRRDFVERYIRNMNGGAASAILSDIERQLVPRLGQSNPRSTRAA